ncbi:hypothetical protein Cgig2_003045 [Carnegiea gigantea]|uniref:Uncharacterized protein n=1 Tax=Carnegiea gigantea TaxID=171969 RepID=A0A9Q1JSX0_9CARY|nr:hypothetical protein Cgig2_003045 [Carnegiea gigantea]
MDTCRAETITFLLSALRVFVDPTEDFKEILAKFLLKICTEGNEFFFFLCGGGIGDEVGQRKENCVAAGFGVVKGDEEDYITGILKRTPVVIAIHYTTLGQQKTSSNVASSTIYALKKHVVKKQIEKGLKRAGDICNHAALLIGAETYADGVNYCIVQDLTGPHIHDDGTLYSKCPST